MQRFVLGARKQWKDLWGVTSWLAPAAKTFVICVLVLGSLTIKTILSVISTRRGQMR